jgi:hypothetical protein
MSNDANYRVTVNGDNATVHVTSPATNQVERFTFNVAGAGSYNKADAIAIAQVLDVDTTGTIAEIMKRVKIAALENRTTFVKPGARSQPFQLTYDELKMMSERNRPFTFGAPRMASANAALRAEHTVTHYIGVPAYGHTGKSTANSAQEATEAKAQWKFSCISFEVWCQLTGYDDSKENGGELFQRMCHYLLVDGRASTNTTFKTQYFDKHGQLKGPNWETVRPANDTYWDKTTLQYAYVSNKSGAWKQESGQGGRVGYNSQGGEASNEGGGAGFDGKAAAGIEVPVSVRPASKANWLFCLGISFGKMGEHGTHAQQFTSGVTSLNPESSGESMAKGNRLGALIGLYYYPQCNKPEYNWVKSATIEGKQYHIRMRLPNPTYKRGARGALFVSESNNAPNKATHDFATDIIGGENGFKVGTPFENRGVPMMHINLFLHPNQGNLVSIVAPYFGSESTGYNSRKATIDRKHIQDLIANNPGFETLLHIPQDNNGFFLGFKMPKALWLYPHVVLAGDNWVDHNGPANPLYQPYWQPTPTQSSNINLQVPGDARPPELFAEGQTLHSLLTKPMDAKYDDAETLQLRRYVLGVATPAAQNVQVTLAAGNPDPAEVTDQFDQEDENVRETPRNTDAQPDVNRDVDDVTGQGGQAQVMAQDQNNFAMEFGARAIDVNSVRQNLSFAGLLPEGVNATAADLEASGTQVPIASAFDGNRLEPGAVKAAQDVNEHFTSVFAQPWPHSDIYDHDKHKFKTRAMNERDEAAYQAKYGDVSNLYIRSTQATEITGVEVQFGHTKQIGDTSVLDMPITYDNPIFRKNLRRILAIYYHDSGIGVQGGFNLTFKQKQDGMRLGMYRAKDQSTASYKFPAVGASNNRGYHTTPAGRVFHPVFDKFTPPPEWAMCFEFHIMQGQDKDLLTCVDSDIRGVDLSKVKSTMTVGQWVQSPWHLAYLPYQPQKALFRDGETYSEGCRRCSRPFYEYEEEYSWYKYSLKGTQHWPTSYWQLDDTQCGKRNVGNKDSKAPLPFHDEIFWTRQRDGNVTKPKFASGQRYSQGDASTPALEDIDAGVWHNWPTYEFNMPGCEMGYRGLKPGTAESGQSLKKLYIALNNNKEPATFRKYYSHSFDLDRVAHQQRLICQGKPTRASAKVKTGMIEYKLRRASKYCNVCNDCAITLETAPGLYLRNHRVIKHKSVVQGNDRQVNSGMDWWTNILARANVRDFSPSMLHRPGPMSQMNQNERVAYKNKFDAAMSGISDYLRDTQHSLPGNRTKFSRPPDINVQNATRRTANAANKKRAKETLQRLLDAGNSQRSDLPADARPQRQAIDPEEYKNPAFLDGIADLVRRLSGEETFERDDSYQVFDSNTSRKEYRNEAWAVNGETWHNCLRVRSWVPRTGVRRAQELENPVRFQQGAASSFQPNMEDYNTTLYLATRVGSKGQVESGGVVKIDSTGQASRAAFPLEVKGTVAGQRVTLRGKYEADKSQWGGDGNVTYWLPAFGEDAPHRTRLQLASSQQLIQTRTLRQSRLFITYSLHRPVTSEMEARLVMERMANAAHVVFGDDRYLSRILVFGQKLVNFSRDKSQGPDQISAAHFDIIAAPRKKEARDTFYADGQGSSYVFDQYDSHVDKVEVDGGIEIGPQMKHPHFHILVTISHYTYIQIDYFQMNTMFELLFRGHDQFGWFPPGYVENNFMLIDASGGPFYTDNEHPYVDIRLYPQDNWQEVLHAYVRKDNRTILGAADRRAGQTTQGMRPNDYNRP